MRKFNLGIKDKCGVEVCEGSILGFISSKRKGYQEGGKIIKKKVVFGKANPDGSALTDYIGFWAVPMYCKNTAKVGANNYGALHPYNI